MRDVDEALKHIYAAFASDSGVLFGIPPEQKDAVRAIVQATLDWVEEGRKNDNSPLEKRNNG